MQVVLADRALLGGLHRPVGYTDDPAVHLQLEQHAQRVAKEVAAAVHTAGAAVPAVAQGDQQFVLARAHKAGHIVGLDAQVLVTGKAAGGQHHIADAHAVQPRRVQPHGRDIQPGAAGGRGENPAQIAGRAMGLVRPGRALAGDLLFGLLALPVRAGKGVDGVVAGDVLIFGLRAGPDALPIGTGQAGLENSFVPSAGNIVFIP